MVSGEDDKRLYVNKRPPVWGGVGYSEASVALGTAEPFAALLRGAHLSASSPEYALHIVSQPDCPGRGPTRKLLPVARWGA
jgi:hypothetical protein